MTIKPIQMERLLLKAGFFLDSEQPNGGHRRYRNADGRIAEVPFHSRELAKGTEMKIRKVARLHPYDKN